jgi:hypothetical protein
VSLLCPLREQIAPPGCFFSFSFFEGLELFSASKFPLAFIEKSLAESNQAATSSSFDILALGRELPIGIRVIKSRKMAARAEVWLSTAGRAWGFERDGSAPAPAAAPAAAAAAGAAVDVACPIDSKSA